MASVIFLNGISSSGKSSIVKAIQHIAPVPFLKFGVDTILDVIPDQYLYHGEKSRQGCHFSVDKNMYGRTASCHSGTYGKKVLETRMKVAKTILNGDLNLIIDEVIWDVNEINAYYNALEGHPLIAVKVLCCRATAQEREFLRGNREIGLANDQFERFESMDLQYDIEINTDKMMSFEAAKQILSVLSDHPFEKRFK
jgi:chloramphenicol 3-O phosphotransferase